MFTTSVADFSSAARWPANSHSQLQYIIGGDLADFDEERDLDGSLTSTTTAIISVAVLLFGAGIFLQTKPRA